MCAGAALQARVGTVVYGAPNPMLGADGGWVQLLPPWRNATATSNGFGTTSDSEDGGPMLRPHAFNPNMTVSADLSSVSDTLLFLTAFL
jgi:tRNA(adenine34) deaminase